MTSFAPRSVTSYGVEHIGGWPAKVYGMTVTGVPSTELVSAARTIAATALPAPVGRAAFLLAHQARPACFVLVCWWSSDIDLCQRYYRSPLNRPSALAAMPPEAAGCVWELAVTAHERDAWIRHMLDTDQPDLASYLADTNLDNSN